MTSRRRSASLALYSAIFALATALLVSTAHKSYAAPLLSFQNIDIRLSVTGDADDVSFTVVRFSPFRIQNITYSEFLQLSPADQKVALRSHFLIDEGQRQRIHFEEGSFFAHFGIYSNASSIPLFTDHSTLQFTITGTYVLTETATVFFDSPRHDFLSYVLTVNESPLTDHALAQAYADYKVAPFPEVKLVDPIADATGTVELTDAFDEKGSRTARRSAGPFHMEMKAVEAGPHAFTMEMFTRADTAAFGEALSALELAGFSLGVIPLPEPSSLLLVLAGMVALVICASGAFSSRPDRRRAATRVPKSANEQ